jgi:hypothetical protein
MGFFRRITLVLFIVIIPNYSIGQSHGWTVNPADYSYNGEVTAIILHGTDEVNTGTLGVFVGETCRGFADGKFFPPTGKTVFTVVCFSNQASGEILTFRYFDPLDGSFYIIKETIEFVSDMIIGSAMLPLEFHWNSIVNNNMDCQINGDIELKAYPNPSRALLNVEYSISELSHVILDIYDFYGRVIKKLVDDDIKPDRYAVNCDLHQLPAGTYIIRLQAGARLKTQQVSILK